MLENKRKQLRLKNYDYSSVGAYFVTVCLQNRGSELLGNKQAKEMIERWVFKIEENFPNTSVDYYVVMKDHVHLIIL